MGQSEADRALELSRRAFLCTAGAAGAGLMLGGCGDDKLPGQRASVLSVGMDDSRKRGTVRGVFVYPPSEKFADDPKGWWSWPGTEFDAEGRQVKYTDELKGIQQRLGMTINVDDKPVVSTADAKRIAAEITKDKPDGLLIMMFYNRSLKEVDLLLEAGEKRCFVEIKNCTLVVEGLACFPDAVTSRGLKHLIELQEQVKQGDRSVMFYLIQRMDADRFEPADHIDPAYGQELRKAVQNGVEVFVYDVAMDLEGIRLNQPVPFQL